MKKSISIAFLLLAMATGGIGSSCEKPATATDEQIKPIPSMPITVPAEGNSWYIWNTGGKTTTADFTEHTWDGTAETLRTYFRVEKAGELHLGIVAKNTAGKSVLEATFNSKTFKVEVTKSSFSNIYIASVAVEKPGYYYLDLKGISKESATFVEVTNIILGGEATSAGIVFSNKDYFYWGRRGPSVHLGYEKPAQATDVVWFYNEVTVTEGNDVIGSYYMATGFGQGYFGMQVNSETERRVLFSVWSPYNTDNPNDIPEEQRVKLLKKGEGVYTGEFGNEGSGGQSYWKYNWITGNTYKFLLKGVPAADNRTEYSAYFYAPELGVWKLIASWSRPITQTYLTNHYSFLENFDTKTGPLVRQVYFNNQWVCDKTGKWFEITRAKYTADATARDKARMDYAGGFDAATGGFFLKNCGFFSDKVNFDTYYTRPAKGVAPDINFEALPIN